MKKATVTPGVIIERVGDDLMVIVPGNTDVVSLSGRPAEVLLEVQAGRDVDPSEPALETLSELGIVTSPGMSRRGLIKAGAIGAGAGIAVMAMPGVAAASSEELSVFDGDAFALWFQGSTFTDQIVMDEFSSQSEDLYIYLFIEYAGSNVDKPTTKTTGTVTSDKFSGLRNAVFFPTLNQGEGQWIAFVRPEGDVVTGGTFELKYQGILIAGPVSN